MAQTLTSMAQRDGRTAGHALATWAEIGESNAQALRDAIDSCSDSLPRPNLSGEWAGDPTPATVAHDLGIEPDDNRLDALCDAWQESADRAYQREIDRRIAYYLN